MRSAPRRHLVLQLAPSRRVPRRGLPLTASLAAVALLMGTLMLGLPTDPASAGPASTTRPLLSRTCDAPPTTEGPSPTSGGYHAQAPVRLLDTRDALGALTAGCVQPVDLSAVAPPQATAVALSVVAVGAEGPGFVTAYPCGQGRPTASNLNPQSATAVSNLVTVGVPSTRQICLYTNVTTNLVIDLDGWFGPAGNAFQGLPPTRILDSRTSLRPDGGSGPIEPGQVVKVPVAGHDGVSADASAVAVNLTVDATEAAGYLTAFPCADDPPLASSANYGAGDTRATQAFVALDGSGSFCVISLMRTELVIDVSGAFVGHVGDRFVPLAARRVLDTRDGTGGHTGPVVAGQTVSFDPTLGGTVAVGAGTTLDVIATGSVNPGWLAVRPCDAPSQVSSTVNFAAGATVANLTTIPTGTDGLLCVDTNTATDVVIDVDGSFGATGGLRGLSVANHPLTPGFTPDGHDYGIICAPGTNAWTVTATGVPGATVTITGADGGGHLSVVEDQAVTIVVTRRNGAVETYLIRCLPHDFPPLSVNRPDDNTPGWYLMSPGFLTISAGSFATILDEHGAVVWYQRTPAPVLDMKLLPDGNLGWTPVLGPTFGTNPTGAIQEHKLDGSLVRTWSTVGSPTDHHDFEPLPNGNMLMITYHQRTGVDVSTLPGTWTSPATVADAWIQEIRPNGTVAWQWHSEDHIAVNETVAQTDGLDITYPLNGGGTGIDLIHLNSIDVDPVTGDVIASARHLDAVLRIRRDPGRSDDGRVLWKLGGTAPAESGTTDLAITGDPANGPHRQHDARLLPNGDVTMFDNETVRPRFASRAVEYHVDAGAGTAALVWQHGRNDTSQAFGLGSVRRGGDGSTLISWGPLAPAIEEVDRWGNTTFTVTENDSGAQYRVVKEPIGAFDRATLRALAG